MIHRSLMSATRTMRFVQQAMSPSIFSVSSLSRDHLLEPCPYSTKAGLDIPRLPVPPLRQTLDRFLLTVQPLLAPDKYQHATNLVHKFADGDGKRLQQLLENKAKHCINWLEEWWLNVSYLEYRLPVTIHVNPGIYTPRLAFRGQDQQLRHAANLITRVLEFKKKIDNVSLPVDKMGSADLCMKQFYRILGCCRIPSPKRDDVVVYPGGLPDSPRHITVLHNNHIFSVNVYNEVGQPLTSAQLFNQLIKVIGQSQSTGLPIGLLTTEHRDTWSSIYQQLLQDETNKRNLSEIHRSIFVLSLDKSCLTTPSSSSSHVQSSTDINSLLMGQVNHGGGSNLNTANRWFDKIFQVFISPDGLVGFNYEHSAAEGPPIVQLVDHCYLNLLELTGDFADTSSSPEKLEEPKRLEFNVTTKLQSAVQSAATSIDNYKFDGFGKDVLKSLKVSPDAFIQVAFQLAYYRLHREFVPTYESGSLRKFQHGRTDTIRSCSNASKAFCLSTNNSDFSPNQKQSLLRAAIDSHRQYTDQVINGNGIDRHLLGLKLIAADNKLPVPPLLTDSVYTDTCNWRMSTSQVASKSGGLLCFAPVVSDGYGICYNPMDDKLLFAVSSWKDCLQTNAESLADSIGSALMDMKKILSHTTSKL